MYAGPFNQGAWLRSWIRQDLVDEYERRCKKIVNSFEGVPTDDTTLRKLAKSFGNELAEMMEIAIKERDMVRSDGDAVD